MRLGPWHLRVDPAATRAAHAGIDAAGPEVCECPECRNFIAAREAEYPPQLLDLFESLGVPRGREVDVSHLGWTAARRLRSSTWVHFVGEVVEGPPESETSGHAIAPGFRVWIDDHDRATSPAGEPMLCLVFAVDVPWVLDEPPPDHIETLRDTASGDTD